MRSRLWTDDNFDFDDDTSGDGGTHPRAQLKGDLPVFLDLSSIPEEKEFTLACGLQAVAINSRGRESGIGAYLRDPQKTGGTTIETTGLEPTNNPLLTRPVDESPPVCTSGPDPAAGVLQLSSATYTKLEQPFSGDNIVVTRMEGSSGAVSVKLTSSDGTASAGVDYTAVNTIVRFGDGDTAPRVVPLGILSDAVEEPDKTVSLTLSEPDCATLGTQSSAVLTIRDDDAPVTPPPGFTIGGTVAGLVGTGLVLQNLGTNDLSPGNGAFTFTIPFASGNPYNVTVATQPTNPTQVCTVANGSGTVGEANITNVSRSRASPPTRPLGWILSSAAPAR